MNSLSQQAFRAERPHWGFRNIWRRTDLLAASLFVNLASLALPFVVLQVYDRMIPFAAMETFTIMMIGLLAVLVLEGIVRALRTIMLNHYGSALEHQTSVAAIRHLLSANTLDFEKYSTSEYLERLQSIDQIREFYAGQSIQLVVDFAFAGFYLVLVWVIAGSLVMIPITLLAIFTLVSFIGGRALRSALEERAALNERRQNFMIEMLRGIHTVKATAMEGQIQRRYERLQAQSAEGVYKLSRINSMFAGLGMTLAQAASISFVGVGSFFVINNQLTIGALAAGTMLSGRILQPALQGMGVWSQYQGLSIAFDDLEEIFDIASEFNEHSEDEFEVNGELELRNVTFRYPKGDQAILRDLNLEIGAGEVVGITGPNGCGKSTLLSLLMGHLTPQDGEVLMDGRPVGEIHPNILRNYVRIMPQQGVIFKGSILENLTLFREGHHIQDAIALSQKLGLDQIISRLPDGLDTDIGGTPVGTISEGVRQKIVIVRALVGNPKVVLFDDANANFDFKNDNLLLELMKSYRPHTTIVIVSHRPAYLRLCNRVFELNDGCLTPTDAYKPQPPKQVEPPPVEALRA